MQKYFVDTVCSNVHHARETILRQTAQSFIQHEGIQRKFQDLLEDLPRRFFVTLTQGLGEVGVGCRDLMPKELEDQPCDYIAEVFKRKEVQEWYKQEFSKAGYSNIKLRFPCKSWLLLVVEAIDVHERNCN